MSNIEVGKVPKVDGSLLFCFVFLTSPLLIGYETYEKLFCNLIFGKYPITFSQRDKLVKPIICIVKSP